MRESEVITYLVDQLNKANVLTREEMGLRILKCFEEAGEAAQAWVGFTAQNPRKGRTHTKDEVVNELLDVATTALVAAETILGKSIGTPFHAHLHKLMRRWEQQS